MMRAPPKRPPWMKSLPGLYAPFRELACPANAFWLDGKPLKPVTGDATRALVLAMRRRCWVCGHPIQRGRTVYDIFADILPHTFYVGGLVTTNQLGPMHLSCAFYSACRCPFLKYPISKAMNLSCHPLRGDASIVGYAECGIVYFDAPSANGNLRECGFRSVVERRPYKSWKELEPFYDEVIADDAATIDMAEPRLFWTDSDDDLEQLGALARADERMDKWAARVPGAGLKYLDVAR